MADERWLPLEYYSRIPRGKTWEHLPDYWRRRYLIWEVLIAVRGSYERPGGLTLQQDDEGFLSIKTVRDHLLCAPKPSFTVLLETLRKNIEAEAS